MRRAQAFGGSSPSASVCGATNFGPVALSGGRAVFVVGLQIGLQAKPPSAGLQMQTIEAEELGRGVHVIPGSSATQRTKGPHIISALLRSGPGCVAFSAHSERLVQRDGIGSPRSAAAMAGA